MALVRAPSTNQPPPSEPKPSSGRRRHGQVPWAGVAQPTSPAQRHTRMNPSRLDAPRPGAPVTSAWNQTTRGRVPARAGQ